MNRKDTALNIKNLSRTIHSCNEAKVLVNNFSFEFRPGRIYNIIGPSGAGKSSLLRLINRLDEPDDGSSIMVGDDNANELNPCLLRRKVGYLFQAPHLFDGSVIENIRYSANDIDDDQITELAGRVHLSNELLHSDTSKLSVGEKQRVALARLLALKPEILLLDEPTSSLDPTHTQAIETLIKEIVERDHLMVLLVTHQPEQALRMGGAALLLVAGKLIESGPVSQVIESPRTEQGKLYSERKLI